MEELFDLFAGTRDGVVAVDSDQRIAFWNQAAGRILGFDPDAVLGRFCYDVLGGTDEAGCRFCRRGCAAFRAASGGELFGTRDLHVRTRDGGSIRVGVTTFLLPSRCRDLSLLVHVFRDVRHGARVRNGMEATLRASGSRPDAGTLEPDPPTEALTRREAEILRLLAAGASTEAICGRLEIARSTARTHVQNILSKFHVHSRLEAVTLALRTGQI